MRVRVVILLLLFGFLRLCAESHGSVLRRADAMLSAGKYEDAVSLYRAVLSSDIKQSALRLMAENGLARSLRGLGCYGESAVAYERALSIAESGAARRSDIDNLRFNLSQFCLELGQYRKAIDLLNAADFRPGTSGSSRKAGLMAMIEARMGNGEKAIEIIDSVMSEFTSDDVNRAVLVQNRGYINWDINRFADASADLKSAMEYLDGDTRYVTMANLAVVDAELGNYDEALSLICKVISYFRSRKDTAGYAEYVVALRKKAEILYRAGRADESAKAFRNYFDNERQRLVGALAGMPPQMRLDYWQMSKPLLSRCFVIEKADPAFLFDVAMFRRQTSLLGMRDTVALKQNLLADSRSLRNSLHADEAVMEIVGYEPVKDSLCYAALLMTKKGGVKFLPLFSDEFVYRAETVGKNSLYNAVTREDPVDKNLLYSDTALANMIWRPVIGSLSRGVTKLYFTAEGIFHLFAIENMPFDGRHAIELHRVTSTASLIYRNEACKNLLGKSMVIGGLDYDTEPSGGAVADTLPAGNHNAYSELSSHMRLAPGSRIFTYLPCTRTEADSVGSSMPHASVYHEMSEENLKNLMPEYDFVHIATHGYCINAAVGKRPEFLADSIPVDKSLVLSGIALSGANKMAEINGRDDAVMSAREICDMDLTGVDFVVLSACQTAKGDIYDEGAAGLIRGLKMAGVKTIIASLWSVDDASTSLFMKEFYKRMSAGVPRHKAFVEARDLVATQSLKVPYRKFSAKKLARDRTVSYRERPPFSEPYYWAPFIIIDDF